MATYLYFFCTHCRARNPWPANYVGKTLTCPACQKSFVDDDPFWPADEPQPKTTPSHLQSSMAQEEIATTSHSFPRGQRQRQKPPKAGIREVPSRSRAGKRAKRNRSESVEIVLTDELQPMYNAPGLQEMQSPRRSIYCLLVKTFQRYTETGGIEFFLALVLAPFIFVITAGLLFLFTGVVYYVSLPCGLCLAVLQNPLLALVPLIVVLVCVSLLFTHATTPTSLACDETGKAKYFHLGKIGDALDPLRFIWLGAYFGMCVGTQVGFLYFLNDRLGSGHQFGFYESILTTLDNVLHGLFLGAFESFDLHFTDPVRHSTSSAIWFFLFRLAFDAIVLLLILQYFRRASLRSTITRYPPLLKLVQHPATPVHVAQLTDWIDSVCQDEKGWLSTFPDELIFLALSSEYLKGNDAVVREIARKFSGARINTDVKLMFGNEAGEVLFSAAPES